MPASLTTEAQWISSFHVLSGHTERLEPDPGRPCIAKSELIATGEDDI